MPDIPEIVSIINSYTFLEKRGNIYTGFCPFCASPDEKLIVRPELNEWHCFQCGAGGDVDDFVALYESLILHRQTGSEDNRVNDNAPSYGAEKNEGTEGELPQDNENIFTDYVSRLRNVPGYLAAAIIDGNMQVVRTDSTTGEETDFNQLNALFISIIDDAHSIFAEGITTMESEVIMSSDRGIVLYSALQFRDEPMHIIVLGKEQRHQHLMRMEINRLKRY